MEYQIYKQFPEDISEEVDTYEGMSAYLSGNGVRNIVDLKGNGRRWKVIGQIKDLEMIVQFEKISSLFNDAKTEMVGNIKTKYSDKATQAKATKLLQIVSGYSPSEPKEE